MPRVRILSSPPPGKGLEPFRAPGFFLYPKQMPASGVVPNWASLPKRMPTLDTIGRNAGGIGFFRGFCPQISQVKQKIQTGISQKLAGFEPPNSLEIYSALFEMGFFKKGAVFIPSKKQSAKGVNLSANRLKGWRLFSYSEKGRFGHGIARPFEQCNHDFISS